MKIFYVFFLVLSLFLLPKNILAKDPPKEKKVQEEDVKELEELIEGKKPEKVRREVAEEKKEEGDKKEEFYKSFGENMSIRGDGKFFYIKAGATTIVVDSEGRVQIDSAENIIMKSKKSIQLEADENIQMKAGGEIVQLKGEAAKKTFEGPKPDTQWFKEGEKAPEGKVLEEDVKQPEAAPSPEIKSPSVPPSDEKKSDEEKKEETRESSSVSQPAESPEPSLEPPAEEESEPSDMANEPSEIKE